MPVVVVTTERPLLPVCPGSVLAHAALHPIKTNRRHGAD
jgi:hypothetical protein